MVEINYKSDFDFILRLIDCRGNEVGVPEYDWHANFYTSSQTESFVASCLDGKYTNCFDDNGKIHIVCNSHNLLPGTLKVEFVAEIPNGIYPDDFERVVNPQPLDIKLVRKTHSCVDSIEVDVILPYIKGDPFTFDDFTPEQLEFLKGPKGDTGLSAYEQAVIGGYDGTEQEFSQYLAKADEMVSHVPTDNELEAIEPNIITDALRKTEQALTPVEKEQVLNNLDNPQLKLFIDQWNAACGKYGTYNSETGFFELNGLTDITYEEAIKILLISSPYFSKNPNNYYHTSTQVRTFIPNKTSGVAIDYSSAFHGERKLEVLQILSGYGEYSDVSNLSTAFASCEHLKEIKGYLIINSTKVANSFYNCFALEKVLLQKIAVSINLGYSPLLSLESLQYMVTNAVNTNPITITVHPEVYAKLTDETNTEWHKVLTDAADKNIQFATA